LTHHSSGRDHVACRLCGGPTVAAFNTTDRNRRLSEESFAYVRCERCGTLSLANVPRNLGRYYPPDYYRLPPSRAALLDCGLEAESEKLAQVRQFVATGRLVEIGPAVGAFLAVSQEAGYQVEAIEMDADCCQFLESELRVPTTRSDDPATALMAAGPYDAIAMWQVIEHLPDPTGVIAAAARALAPGGILAVSAPNPESWQGRLFGARWTHIDAPRHLALMPVPALARVGDEHGLEIILATSSDSAAKGWNRFGWRESLANSTVWPPAAASLRVLGSVLARAFAPFEQRKGRGSTYTLIMRRRG
jgi:SAM-dependent methyltransferase